jgi:glutathione S-transferase
MAYTLMSAPDSAGLVVRMLLEEFELPYDDVVVDRSRGGQRDPAFLALNPQGLLPVLIDPDQDEPVFETAAILLHLTDRHRLPGWLTGRSRGHFLKWLFFLSNTLHADLRIAFYAHRYIATGHDPAPVLAAAQARILDHLALVDRELARSGAPFFGGRDPDARDFYAGTCVRWSQLYPRDRGIPVTALGGFSSLLGMVLALQDRPAVLVACASDAIQPPVILAPAMPAIDPARVIG